MLGREFIELRIWKSKLLGQDRVQVVEGLPPREKFVVQLPQVINSPAKLRDPFRSGPHVESMQFGNGEVIFQ